MDEHEADVNATVATPLDRLRSATADVDDTSTKGTSTKGNDGDNPSQTSRPKRQAAMNRPDYHALHHHIATPTARWLDLIHNPEKYNTTISDGEFIYP